MNVSRLTASKRFRAISLAVAAAVVMAAGLVPACGSMCCPKPADATIFAPMPCCTTPTMSPSSAARTQPVTLSVATAAPDHSFAATIDWSDPPEPPRSVRVPSIGPSAAHHRPAPPLFLRNAQFLI